MGTNRDPDLLKEMWTSWNDNVGSPMRDDYARDGRDRECRAQASWAMPMSVRCGARNMTCRPMNSPLTDKLWTEVKPLYDQLHCYTRTKLNEKYGDAVQAKTGPIRADLLGNMWAQEWGNIYEIVAPKGAGDIGYDTGELLKEKGYDPLKMVKTGEGFYFSSLGLRSPLPETFWQRSQITKPADREVVCHASRWDLDNVDDLRIKMCTKVNADDFVTIHHELGHNYYQRAYNKQPFLYLNGANDGFHEAIGDFIALSITPEYLVQIGLLDATRCRARTRIHRPAAAPGDGQGRLPALRPAGRQMALGRLRGQAPADTTRPGPICACKYQGIVPPVARDETNFDAGAKYHIPGNTPYTRYFLARILQFQFYKAACNIAKWKGPLHRCSFYGNKEVGAKAERHAGNGRVQALARRTAGLHRQPRDGWHGDDRLFQAADDLAQTAEQGQGNAK
jgi:peptidyl-dipeptidase A